MFRIRTITEGTLPADRKLLEQVQALLAERLPGMSRQEIASLPERLRDPLTYRLQAILLVADDLRGNLKGFALVSHVPDVGFGFLDSIATDKAMSGSGVGGALYQRVREVSRGLGAFGLFFECQPDDPALLSDPSLAAVNAARLKFYERFGARPLVAVGYETPVEPGRDRDLPHLVYDDLVGPGKPGKPLRRERCKAVVRTILERKYADICPPDYIERVLAKIKDDPVRVREPRYARKLVPPRPRATGERLIALVLNEKHEIHHVRERGYVESPVRIASILEGIEETGLFLRVPPREFPEVHLRAVHDGGYVNYLKKVCAGVPPGKSIYPYVFPVRNAARRPQDLAYAAGYYCIDTFTPLNQNAYLAAKRAVDCALTAADIVLSGQRFAYALVRPPGHHAERSLFGGFCYFNNAAVAAHYLSNYGKVAVLDIDYHHGNGTQEIFYDRSDVLTVSIHGHPRFAYPFFTGFEDERGQGAGEGFNLNLPLPEQTDGSRHRQALRQAIRRIEEFAPRFLVLSLGFDTARKDPTGTWSLMVKDFEQNGQMLGALGLPTVIVQEGGYRTASLGSNARNFFQGLADAPVPRRPARGPVRPGNGARKPPRGAGGAEPGVVGAPGPTL